ncbi:protein AGENET DOMAIN (AGD)-CONTAINING P1-like [Solanum dulcamara]|uniref:protein AGENET DOMAIN (AGD)-CONTAINING P1-like n=1 Tax=Solanum dulcamara TaxID=45834 RepID=UPI002485F1BB|nr:protein AGENET DOMAIN (AGD)-CONTAINING P1-like [Solanum dulcamara]
MATLQLVSHSIESISSTVAMASTKEKSKNSEERHKSRIDMISKSIKAIAIKKQQTTKIFRKGDEVEVASQVDGFVGSYYNATVVTSFGAYHYGVKYTTLLTNDEASPLEEIVSVSEVRPVPPDHQTETMLLKNDFRLYDMVDVFANDGWWLGLITGKIGQNYYVYFPTTGDHIEYPSDVLRFHQEWSHGEWINLPRTREDF